MPMFEDVLLSSQSISSGQANGSSENADSVTGAGDPSAPMDSGNNLKQLGIALHALDAGECSVDICAKNSPSASPAPDNSRGYAAGHFAFELEGHNASKQSTTAPAVSSSKMSEVPQQSTRASSLTRLAAADRRPRIRLLGLMSWDGPRTTTA